MTQATIDGARALLAQRIDPIIEQDLVSAGAVADITLENGVLGVVLRFGFPADRYEKELQAEFGKLFADLAGVDSVRVEVQWDVETRSVQPGLQPLAGIRNIIAVSSGKGGVGKSTTAVNLALALAAEGAKVGILDADIYGPSQPRMLGLSGRKPTSTDGKRIHPLEAFGIYCMSIGFLIDEDQPMIWRGPMVTQALQQLLGETNWGDIDYLIVDMPPGTGDIQLTLSQRVPVSGAVIVTTPQDIALLDARKGLRMFEKVKVPVLGIVENMSLHICSNCGHQEPIFGSGGGERMAEQYGVPLLGNLPLDINIREEADAGQPSVVADPDGPAARAYLDIARRMCARLAAGGNMPGAKFPTISFEDD
ncbi:iron-sulfur cluster carrier protein ApbC [Wenzhouxiangella sp. XN24]|uniref:iron-sulfur cluster carrier protein ApbC n=1 Tax=Wenzhouxiangella sp. XN24 TaxID=2713569 RepID=UPI0013ED70E7|nr:iron-sulfur cluster carrier protein ApbC [Wenzhouxiangella sp. XN24]NGX15544.1 iron-sulfur cluster carrier protein ApbC [Wenzhouxiangella sp. XN24]